MSQLHTFHTETIELPSTGWFYPSTSPLSSGKVDLYLMTAAHEDILSSKNLVMKGTVIDKLLEALIATKGVNYQDIFNGDRVAIMIAARILGYGKDYRVSIDCPSCERKIQAVIDLQELEDNPNVPFTEENKGKNEFAFQLPKTKKVITFKLLSYQDEKNIEAEIKGLQKINKEYDNTVTTRMAHSIISVDGNSEMETIRTTIREMPAIDAKAFRDYAKKIDPSVELMTEFSCKNCDYEGRVEIPIDAGFFWPDSRV